MKKFNEALRPKSEDEKKLDSILDKKTRSLKGTKTTSTFPPAKMKPLQDYIHKKQGDALSRSNSSSLKSTPSKKLDMKKFHPIFIQFKNVKRMKDIAMYLVEQEYKVVNYKKILSEETMGNYEYFESHIIEGQYVFRRTNTSHGDVINFSTLKGVKGKFQNKTVDPFNEEEWGFEKIEESYNGKYGFEIGDRVSYRGKINLWGEMGKVIGFGDYDHQSVLVEFDNEIPSNPHLIDAERKLLLAAQMLGKGNELIGKKGHCLYCGVLFLKKISSNPNLKKILKPEEDPFGEELYYESKINEQYQNFKIGDRAMVIRGRYVGLEARTLEFGSSSVLLEFDQEVLGGHDGDGMGKSKHCRYLDLIDIKKIENRPRILKPEIDPFGEELYYESKKTKDYTDFLLLEYEGGPPAKPQMKVRNKTVEILSDEEEEEPEDLSVLRDDIDLSDVG